MDITSQPLLDVQDLSVAFRQGGRTSVAVDRISFTINRGECVALVGESGSGKSVSALSVLKLLPYPTASHPSGSIKFKGRDLLPLDENEMRGVRGNDISIIFQEPMTSLNPVFTIGDQIAEAIMLHQKVDKAEAKRRAVDALRTVKIPEPERRVNEYPHQFSGGMRQRAMIAMALSCNPQLLIADEPTTALDVTIQAQILDLLAELQQKLGMSILMITHDLGIIAEMADDVAVMYASKVVEQAPVQDLFARPLHPYTVGLFQSRPEPGKSKSEKLNTIPGMVPPPLRFPSGCKFHPRCPYVQDICRTEEPQLLEVEPGHLARCHFAGELNFKNPDGNQS